MRPVLELDGARIHDLAGFYDEVERVLIPGAAWGRNLDAFNDILRGGFGTPDAGFVLRWRDAGAARRALGYPATVRYLQDKLHRCHPSNRADVEADLAAASRGEGPTLFDVVIEIIRAHGPGGAEESDGIELELG